MKLSLLIYAFIISLTSPLLYSMNNKIHLDQQLLQKELETVKQVVHTSQKAIEEYQQKFALLDQQIQANKNREQAALKAAHDIRMFNWILGSGIGLIIIGCIIYSYWENEALKNAQRYRRIKY